MPRLRSSFGIATGSLSGGGSVSGPCLYCVILQREADIPLDVTNTENETKISQPADVQ